MILLPDKLTRLTEKEAAQALFAAYHYVLCELPKPESIALLISQSALETGRWKSLHNYNFGNSKKNKDSKFYQMFRCSEIINGKEIWFDPPHIQTHFEAFESANAGAIHYVSFVAQRKRYAKAFQEIINGNPVAYSHELKVAGYYTASESLYKKGVELLHNEFMKKLPTFELDIVAKNNGEVFKI